MPDRILIDVSQSHVSPPASLLNSDGPLPLPASMTGGKGTGAGNVDLSAADVDVDVKSPFDQYTNFNDHDPLDGIDLAGLGDGHAHPQALGNVNVG